MWEEREDRKMKKREAGKEEDNIRGKEEKERKVNRTSYDGRISYGE